MNKRKVRIISCVILLWALLRILPDGIYMPLFCDIPARLASGYYGAALEESRTFTTHGVTIEVVRSCGATDFLVMVFAILAARWWSIFAAYGLTILLNTARLIILVPATGFIHTLFPERFYALGHQMAGTAVFLTSLVIIWEGVQYVKRRNNRQYIC